MSYSGPGTQPQPSVLAPNLYLPILAPNLYLPALGPNFSLPTLTETLHLAALVPKLFLPTLALAMAPNFYLPIQVKILLLLLPQPLVLSLSLLLPPPLLLQLLLLLPQSLSLLLMIEKNKIARDNKEFCTAIFTDLSKAFDFICHDLLIAKLNSYGFDRNALKLISDYLSDRLPETKAGSSFRAYLDIIYGVPQGSILESLLFNIDLCDLFFEDYSSDFASFADDTTPYDCGPTLNEVMSNHETTTEKMFEWFSLNNLKVSASKCHLFLSPYQPVPVNIKGSIIESSNCEKVLEICIDSIFFEKMKNHRKW